jgi:predicted nucleic acid-binding protein
MDNRYSVFLDTNIVADMIDAKRKHHPLALELLKQLTLGAYRIVISEDMLTTLYYISKDKRATLEFFEHIIFVDWDVVPFGRETLYDATRLALENSADLEDTLQCLCAAKEESVMVVTENRDFVECGVEILDYENALSKISKPI